MKPWKLQKFFGDVVYDLRSRGLLPVVILLVVAMVAVPVLISRGSASSPAASLQASASSAPLAPEAESAVVSYSPGIRNYKQRLDDLSAKDPFRQAAQAVSPSAAAASQLSTSVPTTSATGSSSSGSGSATTVSGGSDDNSASDTGTKKHKKSSKTSYTYSVNLLAGDVSTTLIPFNNVAPLTPLPSQTTPVLEYYGLSSDYKRALFLVSNKVDGLTGAGTCLPAGDDCSLLSLAPGQSEDLHSSKDGHTYRVVLAKIKRVAK